MRDAGLARSRYGNTAEPESVIGTSVSDPAAGRELPSYDAIGYGLRASRGRGVDAVRSRELRGRRFFERARRSRASARTLSFS